MSNEYLVTHVCLMRSHVGCDKPQVAVGVAAGCCGWAVNCKGTRCCGLLSLGGTG
jgi:hypothetical protein